MAHVAASCGSDQASTWLQLYSSARMLDRVHWSQATPHASKLTLISHTSHGSKRAVGLAAAMKKDSLPIPTDAAALLARTGHTATAAGRSLVLIGGDLRDGPAPEALDVAVLDLPNSRIIQPSLHGHQPPSLREHCTVLLQQQPGSALNQHVGILMQQAIVDHWMEHPTVPPTLGTVLSILLLLCEGHTRVLLPHCVHHS